MSTVRALFAGMLFLAAATVAAKDTAAMPLKQRDRLVAAQLQASGRCVQTAAVAVCADPATLDAVKQQAFLVLADRGAVAIRAWLGEAYDPPRAGATPVFFIARDVGIPHVTVLREPWIFMHPDTVRQDMAPYLHEMVHVMAQWSWRHAEWMGEGFANHVAAAVAERAQGYHRSFVLPDGLARLAPLSESAAGREMLPLIGPRGRRQHYTGELRVLHARLMRDRKAYAPAYYAMSWSFVSFVIERIGVDGLRRLAESAPSRSGESSIPPELSGLREAWLESLARAGR